MAPSIKVHRVFMQQTSYSNPFKLYEIDLGAGTPSWSLITTISPANEGWPGIYKDASNHRVVYSSSVTSCAADYYSSNSGTSWSVGYSSIWPTDYTFCTSVLYDSALLSEKYVGISPIAGGSGGAIKIDYSSTPNGFSGGTQIISPGTGNMVGPFWKHGGYYYFLATKSDGMYIARVTAGGTSGGSWTGSAWTGTGQGVTVISSTYVLIGAGYNIGTFGQWLENSGYCYVFCANDTVATLMRNTTANDFSAWTVERSLPTLPFSVNGSARWKGQETIHIAEVPSAPTNLTATGVSPSQINLGWTDTSSNETSFRIEKSINGTDFTEIDYVGPDVVTYQVTSGLNEGTHYWFRVRARGDGGDSGYSNTADAWTLTASNPGVQWRVIYDYDGAYANAIAGFLFDIRRNITNSQTDTWNMRGVGARLRFNVPVTKTYTHNTGILSAVNIMAPINDGAGTLAITNFAQLLISQDTATNTGTNKYGIYIENISGATNNYQIYSAGTVPSVFMGAMGIGGAISSNMILRIGATNPLSGVSQYGIGTEMVATSAATTYVMGMYGNVTTADAAFVCPVLTQFYADNRAKGAASTITRKASIIAKMQTGGVNNIILSDVDNWTGDYGLYLATANPSYFAGYLSIGGSVSVDVQAYVRGMGSQATGSSQYALYVNSVSTSAATSGFYGVTSLITTAAAAFTCARAAAFYAAAASAGGGSTITRAISYYTAAQTAGSTGNALFSDDSSFVGNFGIALATTNDSYLSGALRVGTTGVASSNYEQLTVRRIVAAGQGASNHSAVYAQINSALDEASTGSVTVKAILADFRRTITVDITDTATGGLCALATQGIFNVANTKTYTNSGVSGILVASFTNSGAGTLAIAELSSIRINASSVANTGTSIGLRIAAISGGTVANYQLYSAGTNPSYFAGTMGIGGANDVSSVLCVGNSNPLTGVAQIGVNVRVIATSAATSELVGVRSNITTANAAFTVPYRIGFAHAAAAKGAASTITRDIGYYATMPTQGGTANVILTDSVSQTGNYGIYLATTNPSYLAGRLSIGDVAGGDAGSVIYAESDQAILTGTSQKMFLAGGTVGNSSATDSIYGYQANFSTPNVAFTTALVAGIRISGIGKGGAHTITRCASFSGAPQTVGTNNAWGTDSTAFTSNWGIYLETANSNYFAGQLKVGTTSYVGDTTEQMSVAKSITSNVTTYGYGIQAANTFNGAVSSSIVGGLTQSYRTITTSQTDTCIILGAQVRNNFNVPAGQTLTNAAGAVETLRIAEISITGAGALAITNLYKLSISADSVATGANKYGIYIGAQSGATTNWQIYSAGSAASYFAGDLRLGTTARLGNFDVFTIDKTTSSSSASTGVQWRVTHDYDGAQANAIAGFLFDIRRNITNSQTDTCSVRGMGIRLRFNAPTSKTYTHATGILSAVNIMTPVNDGAGTLAITDFAQLLISQDTATNTGTNKYGIYIEATSGATNNYALYTNSGIVRFGGDVKIATAGRGLFIAEGANATMGTAVLVGGELTVNTTAVTANSRIYLTSQAVGGTAGFVGVTARVAATSFTITSSNVLDTSTIAWFIVEPA